MCLEFRCKHYDDNHQAASYFAVIRNINFESVEVPIAFGTVPWVLAWNAPKARAKTREG